MKLRKRIEIELKRSLATIVNMSFSVYNAILVQANLGFPN